MGFNVGRLPGWQLSFGFGFEKYHPNNYLNNTTSTGQALARPALHPSRPSPRQALPQAGPCPGRPLPRQALAQAGPSPTKALAQARPAPRKALAQAGPYLDDETWTILYRTGYCDKGGH